MTVTRIIELSCDADGCDTAYAPNPMELTSLRLTRIGSMAVGWTIHQGLDYCPQHRPPVVAQVRELAGKGLTDAQIGARLGYGRTWVYHLRREYGIKPGLGRVGRPSGGTRRVTSC